MASAKLLTEKEVAAVLRCSCEKIRRLRYAGKLAYVPGRPVLIAEDDLNSFIDAEKLAAERARVPSALALDAAAASAAAAAERARKIARTRREKAAARR